MKLRIGTIAVTLLAVVTACVAGLALTASARAGGYVATTTASLSPAPNAAGWNNAPVTITLTATYPARATDGAPGGGDQFIGSATYYRFGGSTPDYIGYTRYDPAAKPVVSTEGPTLVWFYTTSQDTVDPQDSTLTPIQTETPKSVTVNLDMAAPTTAAALDPLPNAHGVNTSPVTVTLTATDALSGVGKTYYRLGSTGDYSEYTAPFTVSTEGTTDVSYYSTDKAGNVETAKILAVTIDLTPPQPKPASGYGTVVAGHGHWATIVLTIRDANATSAATMLQITDDGRVVKTIGLGNTPTNERVRVRFIANLQAGVYRYRIVATASTGLTGRYLKGYLAVGERPTAYIQGAAAVKSGGTYSLRYLLIDPWAKSARLSLQIMRPAMTGGKATNTVVKSIDLGTRPTNVVSVATFRCPVSPGLYRWAFAAQDTIGVNLRTTSNLVWVY